MTSLHRWFPRSFVAWALACAGCATPPPAAAPEASSPAPATSEPPAPAPSAPGDASGPPGARAPVGAGGMCGGIAGFTCEKTLYCSFALEARCGAGDASGTCQARPEACTFEYAPVCGCDDKTYPNACAAASAGVSVAKQGECSGGSTSSTEPRSPAPTPPGAAPRVIAEGQLCGTRGVPGDCAEGFYCAYRSQCGETDSGGVCAKKTQMCTKIYKPVCGCDGKTYGNACTAAAAGVSVRSEGQCPGSP